MLNFSAAYLHKDMKFYWYLGIKFLCYLGNDADIQILIPTTRCMFDRPIGYIRNQISLSPQLATTGAWFKCTHRGKYCPSAHLYMIYSIQDRYHSQFVLQFGHKTTWDSIGSKHFFHYCLVHPIFRFWFLVTFGNKVTKIRKYYEIFVYILQGKMGKTEKKGRKSHN